MTTPGRRCSARRSRRSGCTAGCRAGQLPDGGIADGEATARAPADRRPQREDGRGAAAAERDGRARETARRGSCTARWSPGRRRSACIRCPSGSGTVAGVSPRRTPPRLAPATSVSRHGRGRAPRPDARGAAPARREQCSRREGRSARGPPPPLLLASLEDRPDPRRRHRHRPDPLAGRVEERVRDRGRNRSRGRLAGARRAELRAVDEDRRQLRRVLVAEDRIRRPVQRRDALLVNLTSSISARLTPWIRQPSICCSTRFGLTTRPQSFAA